MSKQPVKIPPGPFPYVCAACEGTFRSGEAVICTACGSDLHEECFENHECLDTPGHYDWWGNWVRDS